MNCIHEGILDILTPYGMHGPNLCDYWLRVLRDCWLLPDRCFVTKKKLAKEVTFRNMLIEMSRDMHGTWKKDILDKPSKHVVSRGSVKMRENIANFLQGHRVHHFTQFGTRCLK